MKKLLGHAGSPNIVPDRPDGPTPVNRVSGIAFRTSSKQDRSAWNSYSYTRSSLKAASILEEPFARLAAETSSCHLLVQDAHGSNSLGAHLDNRQDRQDRPASDDILEMCRKTSTHLASRNSARSPAIGNVL